MPILKTIFTLSAALFLLSPASFAAPDAKECIKRPPAGKPMDGDAVKVQVPASATGNLLETEATDSGEKGTEQYPDVLSKALKEAGAQVAKCTSAYRSPEEQAKACKKICGTTQGCPGLCAKPCSSQHQKAIAVCDLKGISKDPKKGCQILYKICQEKFKGKCGIGGYGGDAYHFGVNDTRFTAWNKCGFLKGLDKKAAATRARTQSQIDAYAP